MRRAGGTEVAPDHIIVKFKSGVSKTAKETLIDRFGGGIIKKSRGNAKFERVSVAEGQTVAEAVNAFAARPEVAYAEPDRIRTAFMAPNDPEYAYQWHFSNAVYGGINSEPAWDRAQGLNVIVAVIDTGIAYEDYFPRPSERYYRGPDLADTSFVPGYDFVNSDNHPNDDQSHGTHVAGTIAQSTNNRIGVAGLAHKAALMPLKVLDNQGRGTDADVAEAIRYAADNGAKVINLSLGGPDPSTTLEEAVAYANGKGVTIVAAAGNDGGPVGYPAAYDPVIAVGATRYDEARTSYSNYGAALDLMAPGGAGIDQNGDGYSDGVLQETFDPHNRQAFDYYFFTGTSMASPHVAGLAALLLSQYPGLTPDEIKSRLEITADDKGAAGWDQFYGWGLINANAAVYQTSYELAVSDIELLDVGAGQNTWPNDDSKNKPASVSSTVPWKLLVAAETDFVGAGPSLAVSGLKFGVAYSQVQTLSASATIEVAAGFAGNNQEPDLSTTLDVPWDEALVGEPMGATLVYTIVPQ